MEINIIKAIQSGATIFFDGLFSFLTLMGEEIFFFLVFLYLYWCYKKEFAFKFGIFYLISYFTNELTKGLFKRKRPWQADSGIINKLEASGSSFPSGHSQGFAFQAGFLGLELNKSVLTTKKRKLVYYGIAIFLGLIVGFTRMYLGQHYLTDVLAGLFLGSVLAIAINFIFNLIPAKVKKVLTLNRILIFFIPVAFVLFCLITFAGIFSSVSKQILFHKFIGGYLGITCGYFIDNIVIKYKETVSKWWHNLVKYIIGIAIIIGLYYLLMAFYPDFTCYYAMVFFILSITASTIIPIIFQMLEDFLQKLENKESSKNKSIEK